MKHIKTFEKFSLTDYLFGKKNVKKTNKNEDSDIFVANKDIKFGDKSENVGILQKSLENLGFKLFNYGVDNIAKYETFGQVSALFNFLKKPEFSKYVDDSELLVIKNKTVSPEQQEFIFDLSNDDELKNEISNYFKKEEEILAKNGIYSKKIFKYIEDPRTFTIKLQEICKKLQIENYVWLLLVMWKESRINPKARNSESKATGLIQFMPSTAKEYGLTVDDIRNMNEIEQLDLVYKYYKNFTGRLKTVQDVYAVTFFPAAIGKEDDYVLKTKNVSAKTIASQNKVIDLNKDNEITRGEFDEYVVKDLPSELKSKI